MNLNNLHYFIVITEEMSFTRAAARLYVSQQAVSNYVKNLESELGVRLYNRKPFLSLTPVGEKFYHLALDIMDLQQKFHSSSEVFEKESIRLGIGYARSKLFGPKLLSIIQQSASNLHLSIIERPATFFLEQDILLNEIDFFIGVSPIRSRDISTVDLSSDSMLLVVPKLLCPKNILAYMQETDSPFISKTDGISLTEFASVPFLLPSNKNSFRFFFNQYAGDIRFTPKVIFESTQMDNLFFMAIDGMGAAIYPDSLFYYQLSHLAPKHAEKIAVLPLRDCICSKVVLGYSRHRVLSSGDRLFIDLCRTLPQSFQTNNGGHH